MTYAELVAILKTKPQDAEVDAQVVLDIITPMDELIYGFATRRSDEDIDWGVESLEAFVEEDMKSKYP